MKLMRIGARGAERPVVLHPDGRYLDLSALTDDIDVAFLAGPGLQLVRAAIATDSLRSLDVAGQRIGPPIARPGAVICIGMNYATHAAETGSAPPKWPVMFYKATNTVIGPDDQVLIPRDSRKTDWEVELAVVIGRRARYLDSPADALFHVAGYSISNDVSERAARLSIR
jgi:2-keto-4-pentenoate hydratase/2-oxohepta-3-ene-1,7-dioic acid hydratase in catechol pathway